MRRKRRKRRRMRRRTRRREEEEEVEEGGGDGTCIKTGRRQGRREREAHSFMAPVLEHLKVSLQVGLQDDGDHLSLALTEECLTPEVGVKLIDLSQNFSHVRLRHHST